jgi:hypothetical protein
MCTPVVGESVLLPLQAERCHCPNVIIMEMIYVYLIVALSFAVLLRRLRSTSTELRLEQGLRQPSPVDSKLAHSPKCEPCGRSSRPSTKWGKKNITAQTFAENTVYHPLPKGQWKVSPRQAEKRLAMYRHCMACGAFEREDTREYSSFRTRTLRARMLRASRNTVKIQEGFTPTGSSPEESV